MQRIDNRVLFATTNKNKVNEINQMLKGSNIEVVSMEEAKIDIDVVEDGDTFEENAIKKATEIMKVANMTVIADDSGLEIDYLGKEPGIYSARYLGRETPYPQKNEIILDKLKGVPEEKRKARFVCSVAVAFTDGTTKVVKETIEGIIGYEQKGENGFGYDPIFFVPEYNMTTAQMKPEQKNKISHRGKAIKKIIQVLEGGKR